METTVTITAADRSKAELHGNVMLTSIDDDMTLDVTANRYTGDANEVDTIEVVITDEIIDAILDEFPMDSVASFARARVQREVAKLDASIDTSHASIQDANARRGACRDLLERL